ncbi:hypothetical protein NE897_10310 [Yersinia ruckeri]|uniref:hypothetical protein n=1 Tax=Yersinia ruckeri TaxID=29486 RepID=UPI001F2C9264|nr:hypothetical protein [Yersinia ruckeri]EKN3347920.1 hypothetical protein [Yersinia ruckeri]EKN3363138.1 hypothetical protein [Yersinia ruckeri]EKN4202873.1 hypothetical protein [Yersinia ruckeri]EKN4208891.1 hypothetical protein [Yersinia ruckeri]EKN4699392.1 hypothetical protein [Yersinia ruckeri]
MKSFYFSLLFLCSMVSLNAYAFKVDSLLKVMDDKDNNIILSSDRADGREFIHVNLSAIIMSGENKWKEIPLDPNNVSTWPVLIEPGEIVLDAGDEVRVKIIRNTAYQPDDRVIGVSFIPDPESMKINNSSLQVSVGYKTWLVIPGTNKFTGDINAKRDGQKITINNTSNKIIRVLPQDCASSGPSECLSNIISLPGTTKEIDAESSVSTTLSFYDFSELSKKIKEVTL